MSASEGETERNYEKKKTLLYERITGGNTYDISCNIILTPHMSFRKNHRLGAPSDNKTRVAAQRTPDCQRRKVHFLSGSFPVHTSKSKSTQSFPNSL